MTVIDDAETQAQRHLEEAQAEADRIVAERLAALTRLTESLPPRPRRSQGEAETLVATLQRGEAPRSPRGSDFEAPASSRPSRPAPRT